MKSTQSIFRLVVQLTLFAALVWVLGSRVQIDEVLPTLGSFSLTTIVVATAFMVMRFVLLGLRWSLSLTNNRPPLLWSILTEWRILFLEFVLPIPDAEDFFRLTLLRLRNVPGPAAIRSVIRMRVAGMVVLISLLLFFFFLWGQPVLGKKATTVYSILALSILLMLPFTNHFIRIASAVIKRIPKFGRSLAKPITEALSEQTSSGLMSILVVISLCQAVVQAAVIFILLHEMNESICFLHILSIVPLLNLSFILPISIQGFGLPEACLVFVLPYFGVPMETAAAIAVIHLLLYSSMILFGAYLFLINTELTLKNVYGMFKRSNGH